MLDHSGPDFSPQLQQLHKQSIISQLRASQYKDLPLRKRLHHLMAQNFQLKEEVASLQAQLKESAFHQKDLREKLRGALQQIETSDQMIEKSRVVEQELRAIINKLKEQVFEAQAQTQIQIGAVSRLMEHNNNLEAQACMVAEIKQKYQLQNSKIRIQLEQAKDEIVRLQCEMQNMTNELSRLVSQLQSVEGQLALRKGQMQQYQSFVLEKISRAQNSPELHEKCQVEKSKWYCKYLKYKERARISREQRDQLLGHLANLSQQVGSSSMRQYVG